MAEEALRAVVITGASSGIGKACALLMDRSRYHVFAGVRTVRAGELLKAESSGALVPLILDVTNADHIRDAAETVTEAVGLKNGLAGLVNNAGIVLAGPLEFFPLADLRRGFEVNVIGHVALTQAFLSLLREGRGRIVNIGSPSGFFAPPFLGPYAATKFAMEALTDALRREVRAVGIEVTIVEPGAVETLLWDKAMDEANEIEGELPATARDLYGKRLSSGRRIIEKLRRRALSPYAVARVVHRALTESRPKTRYLVGMDARIQAMIARFLSDRLADWLIAKGMEWNEGCQKGLG